MNFGYITENRVNNNDVGLQIYQNVLYFPYNRK